MTDEAITEEEFNCLLEAARWAPSAYNEQPWRIIYAARNQPEFSTFVQLMVPFNQAWASKAAVLGVFISHTKFEQNGKASFSHAYDTGAAWENFALEGTSRGFVVHGMSGFDYEKAKQILLVPEDYEVLAMFAVGKPAPTETLPVELQKKEILSDRKPISAFAMPGHFRK